MDLAYLLPLIFAGLMALAFLMYAILDGYDLGVGLLLPLGGEEERDILIASIGPFWDANETWLVLGVGLLLIAFPSAHSIVLGTLYLPVLVLLVGLILRGVAFDFRAKVPSHRKDLWDTLFFTGSLLACLSQGYMLGWYVLGFSPGWWAQVFAVLSAICVTCAYAFIGGAWLIMKCEGALQVKVASWAKVTLWFMMLGILAVSVVNPFVSPPIFEKWFSLPEAILLLPIPALCFATLLGTAYYLQRRFSAQTDTTASSRSWDTDWLPFAAAIVTFFLCFQGLAYSFYPYVVPFKLTIWEAAAATSSLAFVGVGVAIVFPAILAYTFLSYRVFWGKAKPLEYY
ncbi:MAG: cytochrome d ubiquinol oxidase subunit II [Pseudomonadota bacterium]